jgi:cell division protein FtsB
MTPKWTKVVLALGLFFLVVAGNRGLLNLFRLAHEKNQLSREVSSLQMNIASLQAQYREYGTSSEAVERSAREELDLIKPGETIYKFTSSSH